MNKYTLLIVLALLSLVVSNETTSIIQKNEEVEARYKVFIIQKKLTYISVKLGRPFELRLRGNITTGYNWYLANPNSSLLKYLNLSKFNTGNYIADNSKLMGSPGYMVFKLRPVAKGRAVLKFVYKRFDGTVDDVKYVVIWVV